MNIILLSVVACVIIAGLAAYAGYLLFQLKQQKKLQAHHRAIAIEKRNANIFESVNVLCMTGIQGQCDLSEISIRVYCIMDYLQGDERVQNFDDEYPAIAELYHVVKDMARGESRQELPKRDRMQQNFTRMKAESRLNDSIVEELKALKQRIAPLNNQISIQMV